MDWLIDWLLKILLDKILQLIGLIGGLDSFLKYLGNTPVPTRGMPGRPGRQITPVPTGKGVPGRATDIDIIKMFSRTFNTNSSLCLCLTLLETPEMQLWSANITDPVIISLRKANEERQLRYWRHHLWKLQIRSVLLKTRLTMASTWVADHTNYSLTLVVKRVRNVVSLSAEVTVLASMEFPE